MATLPETSLDYNRKSNDRMVVEIYLLTRQLFVSGVWRENKLFLHLDETSVEQLYQANQELLDKVHAYRNIESFILDLDSTRADTYGDQKETAFNAHYGTVGFHPIIAFDGMTSDFLKAKLRPGNAYISNDVLLFVRPVIEQYNNMFPETTPFLHDDSGFTMPTLYELCGEESVSYVIRLKANANLKKLADELHSTVPSVDTTQTEAFV